MPFALTSLRAQSSSATVQSTLASVVATVVLASVNVAYAGGGTPSTTSPRSSVVRVSASAAGDLTGRWEGTLIRESKDWPIALDIANSNENGITVLLSLPDFGIYYNRCSNASIEEDILSIDLGLFNSTLEARLKSGALEGTWDGGELKADFHADRVQGAMPPPRVEEFRFQSADGVELVGSLIMPEGPGPFPAMVWTHGSGPDNRQTTIYAGKGYRVAMEGVASFIYDKRGSGESGGEGRPSGKELVLDALAAVELLTTHPEIDHTRIGIGGSSQGGWICPSAASQDERIKFMVVGATPLINGAEQNLFSLENRMRGNGRSEEYIQAATKALRSIYEYCRTGENYDQVVQMLANAEAESWASDPLFKRFLFTEDGSIPTPDVLEHYASMFEDAIAPWREVRIPIVSYWGADDWNVPAAKSRDILEQVLSAAGNQDFELVVFPKGTHGITVNRGPDDPWDWPRLIPGYHDHMARWVRRNVVERD